MKNKMMKTAGVVSIAILLNGCSTYESYVKEREYTQNIIELNSIVSFMQSVYMYNVIEPGYIYSIDEIKEKNFIADHITLPDYEFYGAYYTITIEEEIICNDYLKGICEWNDQLNRGVITDYSPSGADFYQFNNLPEPRAKNASLSILTFGLF